MSGIDTSIEVNADFSQPVVIKPDDYQWEASPMPGVDRMKLDRIGDEIARATSLVRYQPNSHFHRMSIQGVKRFLFSKGCLAMSMAHIQQELIYAIPSAPNINRL